MLTDGILTDVRGRWPGMQLVQATDYMVKDFTRDLADGTFKIKAAVVALCVGNDELKVGENRNIARQIEALVRQVWVVKPAAAVFVSSLLPKPTQETQTQALLMKANEGISVMCRRLNKYGAATVKYMPLHQKFLEKWRNVDESTGTLKVITRIVQPHGLWYRPGTDILNQEGIKMLLSALQEKVKSNGEQSAIQSGGMIELPSIKGQVESDRACSGRSKQDQNFGKKPKKGKKGCPEPPSGNESKKESVTARTGVVGTGDKRKRTGYKRQGVREGVKADFDEVQKKQKVDTDGSVDISKRSSVARMVDKWESLSHGPVFEDLDLELGGESVVSVDLGDRLDTGSSM